MTATHFRAYAFDDGVHNPTHESALGEDGAAKFTAEKEIAYVVFYGGGGEEPAFVTGRVDGPFAPGEVSVAHPEDE